MNTYLILLLVILGLLFIIFAVASFIRWNANRITIWFSLKKLDINKPIDQYTRLLLDENGLIDVEVKKLGFFSSLFIGNTYKKKTKTIRLSWLTAKRSTITSLALACKLIGISKLDQEGAKNIGSIAFNRYFGWLPALFLPLVVIGLIVDFVSTNSVGMITLIFTGVGLAITLFSFILSMISLRLETKALGYGKEIICGIGLLNEVEEKKISKLFSAWKKLYAINAVFNAFEMLFLLLTLIFGSLKILIRK